MGNAHEMDDVQEVTHQDSCDSNLHQLRPCSVCTHSFFTVVYFTDQANYSITPVQYNGRL